MQERNFTVSAPGTVGAETTDAAKSSVSAPGTVGAETTDAAKSSVSAPGIVGAETTDASATATVEVWWHKLVNLDPPLPLKPLPEVCTDIFWVNTKVSTIERLWCSNFMDNITSTKYMTEIEIERPYYTTHENCGNFENYGETKEQIPERFIADTGLIGFTTEEGIATEIDKHLAKCFSPMSQELPRLLKSHDKNFVKCLELDNDGLDG